MMVIIQSPTPKKKDLPYDMTEKTMDVNGTEVFIFIDAAWKEHSSCVYGIT